MNDADPDSVLIGTVIKKLDFDQNFLDDYNEENEESIANGIEHSPDILHQEAGEVDETSERSATPTPSEFIGHIDEIQACMISMSNNSVKSSVTDTLTDISHGEDLPLILKRIVGLSQSNDERSKDLLYSSLSGLATYISTATECGSLAAHVDKELKQWLSHIIRLPNYTPYLHKSSNDCIFSLTERLLFSNYPQMEDEGLFALYSKYPVIYMSKDDSDLYSSTLLSKLHLPKSVINIVPYHFNTPNSHTLDVKTLERMISDDIACGKLPLLVIANVGTDLTGHIDNIPSIKHLCDRHGVWLHAKGSCGRLLPMSDPPKTVAVLAECDSVAVPANFILTDLAVTTEIVFINDKCDSLGNDGDFVIYLPFWVLLQLYGSDKIKSTIEDSYTRALTLYNKLSNIDSIQILEYPLTGHIICLRYYSNLDNIPHLIDQTPMEQLMSKLTAIMCERLYESVGSQLSLAQLSGDFNVIRVAPLENTQLTDDDVDAIVTSVEETVKMFDTSLRLRGVFNEEIGNRDNFLLVLDPQHPSIGAFQYLPKYLQDEEACNTPSGKEELNEINENITEYLGEKWDLLEIRVIGGFTVISIPMVSEEFDVSELLNDIIATAPKFENNSKYLAKMSEIILSGIEQANAELEDESERQFYEKGIIRQIPIFGSVFNWMSPIEAKKIAGRSFSLHSGEVQPTDMITTPRVGRSRTTSSASPLTTS